MATFPDTLACTGSGGDGDAPPSPRKVREMPRRGAHRHHHHRHRPSPQSTPLSLQAGEWRLSIGPSAPDARLAEEQTFAEFAQLNLGQSEADGDVSAMGRAEGSLVSLAAATPKRDAEPGTPDDRPAKRRRGLAGVLVDGAVSAAYSWWTSWTQREGADPSSAEPVPASETEQVTPSTPIRAIHPARAVYLSNRRRRALIPSTQRRRAAPGRASGKCDGSRSRGSSPFTAFSSRAGTPIGLPTTPSAPPSSRSVALPTQEEPPQGGESGSSDPDPSDAALERMQSRLDSMISQCRSALSSQPDSQALDLVMAQDEVLFPLPSTPLREESDLASCPGPGPRASLSATLPTTPSLFTSAPTHPRLSTPSGSRPSLSAQPPSRIPIAARAYPPSASTFAFQLRPTSRNAVRAPDPPAPAPAARPRARPASTTPIPSGSPTSPRKLGHRPTLSASAGLGTAGAPSPTAPIHGHAPRTPRKTTVPPQALGALALSPRKPLSGRTSAPPVHPAGSPRPAWRP